MVNHYSSWWFHWALASIRESHGAATSEVMMMAVTAAVALYDDIQRKEADLKINMSDAGSQPISPSESACPGCGCAYEKQCATTTIHSRY